MNLRRIGGPTAGPFTLDGRAIGYHRQGWVAPNAPQRPTPREDETMSNFGKSIWSCTVLSVLILSMGCSRPDPFTTSFEIIKDPQAGSSVCEIALPDARRAEIRCVRQARDTDSKRSGFTKVVALWVHTKEHSARASEDKCLWQFGSFVSHDRTDSREFQIAQGGDTTLGVAFLVEGCVYFKEVDSSGTDIREVSRAPVKPEWFVTNAVVPHFISDGTFLRLRALRWKDGAWQLTISSGSEDAELRRTGPWEWSCVGRKRVYRQMRIVSQEEYEAGLAGKRAKESGDVVEPENTDAHAVDPEHEQKDDTTRGADSANIAWRLADPTIVERLLREVEQKRAWISTIDAPLPLPHDRPPSILSPRPWAVSAIASVARSTIRSNALSAGGGEARLRAGIQPLAQADQDYRIRCTAERHDLVIEAWSGEIQEGEEQWWEKHELLASSDDRTTFRASAGTEAAPVLWWNGRARKSAQAAPVTLVVAHWPGQCGCDAEEFEIEVFLDTLETPAEATSTAGSDAGGAATDPPVQRDAAFAKRGQVDLLMRQSLQLYEFGGDEGAAAAVHLLTSASEIDARDHRAAFLAGMILALRYEDFQEASARFKLAVDRNGQHAPSLNNLAVALARSERVSEALPLFWKAYERDKDNLQIHHNALRLPLYRLSESEHTSVMKLLSVSYSHARTRGISSEDKENGRKPFVLLPLLRGELEVAESE